MAGWLAEFLLNVVKTSDHPIQYSSQNDRNIKLFFSIQLAYSKHFKQDVYEKSSGVQIPIEIYEGCK